MGAGIPDVTPEQVAFGLNALLDLPNFQPERADAVRDALRHYAAGMGFADALRLSLNAGDQKFMTFNKAFARHAKKLAIVPDVFLV